MVATDTTSSSTISDSPTPPLPPPPPAPPRRTIVEFRDVTLMPPRPSVQGLRNVDLDLAAGEVCLVRLESGRECLPLADAALGLLDPSHGSVGIHGKPWSSYSTWQQLQMRGRFGRVFCGEAWVSNLNLFENIILARRHHSELADDFIVSDAEAWALRFGLAELPRERPLLVPLRIRRVSEWVRAFAHSPEVLLLEAPTRDAPMEAAATLRVAIQDALDRGAAVLLQTADENIWNEWTFPRRRRFVVQGDRLEAVETPA